MKTKELAMSVYEDQLSLEETGITTELKGFIKLNKAEIKSKANEVSNLVSNGYLDSLDALIMAKKIQEYGKSLESKVRPIAESKTYNSSYSKYSVEITERVNGASYDFSNCGDKIYDELIAQLNDLKSKISERESFLKTITTSLGVFDPETGETYTINPPIKGGKIGLSLTIK